MLLQNHPQALLTVTDVMNAILHSSSEGNQPPYRTLKISDLHIKEKHIFLNENSFVGFGIHEKNFLIFQG